MVEVNSLRYFVDHPELRVRLLLSDLDYTLINFDAIHHAGIAALEKRFGKEFSQKVHDLFLLMLGGHRKATTDEWDNREQFNAALERVKKKQKSNEHGHRAWSRETWISLVAEDLKVPLSSKDVDEAREDYWNSVEHSTDLFYQDALELFEWLKKNKIPLWVYTGSDSLVKLDEVSDLFHYEADFSKNYKLKRIEGLGVPADKMFVADPFDKPHQHFYDEIFQAIKDEQSALKKEEIYFVGDSPRSDLEVPAAHGYPTVFLNRKK